MSRITSAALKGVDGVAVEVEVRISSLLPRVDVVGLPEAAVREIRRRTRRKFAPEEKIRIVLEGLRGEQSISELCRREGIAANLYYRWSKDFLEAGKKQLAGDTVREATSDEVKDLRSENRELKEVVAEMTLKNRVLKKSLTGHGEEVDS